MSDDAGFMVESEDAPEPKVLQRRLGTWRLSTWLTNKGLSETLVKVWDGWTSNVCITGRARGKGLEVFKIEAEEAKLPGVTGSWEELQAPLLNVAGRGKGHDHREWDITRIGTIFLGEPGGRSN